jgi:hypothetical protein
MTQSEKLDFLVSLFHKYLKGHPNQLFALRTIFNFPEWKELNSNLIYLDMNFAKINSRLARKEGVYTLGDKNFKKFFYSPTKIASRWKWNNQIVARWLNWAVKNRLVIPENHSPFPKMKIMYNYKFLSTASCLKMKFYFPHKTRVLFGDVEASVWELSMLKKPKLRPMLRLVHP